MSIQIPPLATELMNLNDGLHQLYGEEDAMFWIYTAAGTNLNTITDFERREKVREKVDHLISGLMIIHIFAIIEEYCEIRKWYSYLTPDEQLRIRAFQHIRHGNAHKFKANRADRYVYEFNTLMASLAPIRNIKSYDANTIILTRGTCMEFHSWVLNLISDVIARVLKNC